MNKLNEIEINHLDISYGILRKNKIIRDFSIKMNKGEIITLYGKNGVGKTTILRAICGQLPFEKGEILWHGKNLTNSMRIRRLKSSGNFEAGKMLYNHTTLKDNLTFNTYLQKSTGLIPIENDKKYFDYEKLYNKNIGKMSLGQKQKSALICALRKPADLYFFDEPDNGLDRASVEEFSNVIKNDFNNAITVIATHDSFLTYMISTKIIFISEHEFIEREKSTLPTSIDKFDKLLLTWIKEGVLNA